MRPQYSFFIVTLVLSSTLVTHGRIRNFDEKDSGLKIEEYMTRVESSGFSGAILVARDNKIIISKGYGLANRNKNLPVSDETVFTIGSITKQFTGAAILKLQMMEKLKVTDPITKYFDDVPEDKMGITIHHLLTHTAGFPGAIGHDFDPITRDAFIKLAMGTKLDREPGEEYEYSNVGFSLAGAIIEIVTKKSYEKFLNEVLFKPVGMKKTGYLIPRWRDDELAHGYRGEQDWGTIMDHPWAEDGPGWHLRANGGILSTVGDMYKWHNALEGESILSREAKDALYKPHVIEGEGADTYYGYGWSIATTSRNTRLITHNGGNPYFSADFLRFVDEDVVIFVMANTAKKRAFKIAEILTKIVFGENYSLPLETVIPMDMEALRQTSMGKRALALIETMGGPDDVIHPFIQEHFTPDVIKRRSEQIHRFLKQDEGRLGKVEFGEAIQSEENTIELKVMSGESREWWLIGLHFEKTAPHRIAGITVDSTDPPETQGESGFEGSNERWGLPSSITGRRSSALLDVLMGRDEERTIRFINKYFAPDFISHMPMEEHLTQFRKMQEALGDFELIGAMKTGPYSARLKVRSEGSEKMIKIEFELEPEDTHRFIGLDFNIEQ